MKANKIVTNAFKFGILLLGLFYLLFSAQKSFAITVGGGGGQSPGESSGGSGGGNSDEGYGRAVWVYYRINNTTQGVAIGDSYPNDPWGTSFSLPANECGPYGGFWVLQLTSNGASNKAYTASTVVSAVPAQYRWSRENYPLQRPVGGIDNLTVVSPQRLMFDETDYEFKYGLVQTYNETYSSLDKDMNYKTQQGWYVNGLNWDEVMELFKSKNGGSTGGCSAINNGAGDDCWNNSYSRMKYFCYGDDPTETATFTQNGISVSSSSLSKSGNTFTGNGKTTSYNVTATYNIRRTNSNPNVAIANYGTQSSEGSASYPPNAQSYTSELSNGENYAITKDYTISLPVGTTKTICFNLKYDTSVDYIAGARQSGNYAGTASSCYTFKNPEIVYTATFAQNGISVSSSSMSKSGKTFTGNGKSTSYKVTATYNIKRTNNTPSSATSGYGTKSSEGSTSYPGSAESTTSGLANGSNYPITKEYTISLANGQTKTVCFNLKFDSSVVYKSDVRQPGNFAGTASDCYTFYNPAKNTATFTGAISASGSSGLTLDSNTGSTNRTAKGNGLKKSFSITPTYTITRRSSDGNPSYATSNYNINATSSNNDGHYPGSIGYNSGNLAKGNTHTRNGSAASFDIPIDSAAIVRCFYLRYDANVIYYDTSRDSGDFNGRTKMCFTITNPSASYTAHFTGDTTIGYLDPHDRLKRTNNNTMGVIDHATRITNSSDPYTNGSFKEDAYPSSSQYTATFSHKISRTDAEISDKVNNFYVGSAAISWQVQYSLNGGGYQDYSRNDDKNSGVTTGTTDYLAAGGSKTISVNPKWTLDYSNRGKYIYYCQRIRYTETSKYKSASSGNSYAAVFQSFGTQKYTSPLCVTIRNPQWVESSGQDLTHNISIRGRTTDSKDRTSAISPEGAVLRSGTFYDATAVNVVFGFPHMLWRTDSGFDESQIGASAFEPSVTKAFFQSSIYNNNAFKVSTKMYGNERLLDTRPSMKLINPMRANSPITGYPVSLSANSMTDTSTNHWFSTRSDGHTYTTFHADVNNTSSSEYLLLAGQSQRFSQGTYNSNGANWYVRYHHISRCESYTSGYFVGLYPNGNSSCKYDRTELIDRAPVETTPVYFDSTDYTTYTVFRPYNYEITDISPKEASSSDITYGGQNVKRSFTVKVDRETSGRAYVTDPYRPNLYVIGFRILPGQNHTNIERATVGGVTSNNGNAQNDICASFYGASSRLGFGGDDDRCIILKSTTLGTRDGNKNSTYNNIYGPTTNVSNYKYDYSISVDTGDIIVPNDLDIGEKYCVAVATDNYQSKPGQQQSAGDFADRSYYISHATCSNVAKLPSVQIWSGSTQTLGGIKTSTSEARDSSGAYLTFGSWTDFAVIAGGESAKMASGASIAHGISYQDTASILCNSSPLTIANSKCEGNGKPTALGESGIASDNTTIDRLEARYRPESPEITFVETDTVRYETFTEKGLNPLSFFSTQPFVVYSSSDLLIKTDIILETNKTYSSNNAPEVIIIARGNIKIDESVSRLDAWIVSGGHIDTCTDNANPISLSSSVCTNQLNIKGAILGNRISFRRTYAGNANKETADIPAEIVNFTSNTLLFTAREAEKHQLPETTYLKKLPPRY
ncbi:hypothetical protein IKG20_02730 [Candidatus Saccharibacteria bacterium]|nr:hypothetical protein [Candidatus Saccharibacteria bacterium]